MIRHCVFLRFKAATQTAEKQAIYAGITALKDVIPGIVEVTCGPNVSPEGLDGGFVDGFIVTFEDAEVRDYYLQHPAHMEVAERIVRATDGGLSGLLVFDMEV
ncbi:Dabb family protein [Ciceribacter ferrooxidans]|uniref:Dabb family protein n=1 Tax=Ciceribacter ferrooxidans TaxID=2509717 RepID=A0A4Q2T8M0_9HYPH|nr:Dabb family protein [Ciceribacter ferrooxidans]RYC15356.1 Dabb family protein [Ciceribacter ferrooxidans]